MVKKKSSKKKVSYNNKTIVIGVIVLVILFVLAFAYQGSRDDEEGLGNIFWLGDDDNGDDGMDDDYDMDGDDGIDDYDGDGISCEGIDEPEECYYFYKTSTEEWIEIFDQRWKKDGKKLFKPKPLSKKFIELGDLINGCWAIPNDNRPINTPWLEKLMKYLQINKGSDAAVANKIKEAKKLIALWCKKGPTQELTKHCPCK